MQPTVAAAAVGNDSSVPLLPFAAFAARRTFQRTPVPLRQEDLLVWLFQRGVIARLHCEHGTYRVLVSVDAERGVTLCAPEEHAERGEPGVDNEVRRNDERSAPLSPCQLCGRTGSVPQSSVAPAAAPATAPVRIPWSDVGSISVECYRSSAAEGDNGTRLESAAEPPMAAARPRPSCSDDDDDTSESEPPVLRAFFCVETTAGDVLLLLPLRLPDSSAAAMQWLRGMEGIDVAQASASVLDGAVWVQRVTHNCHLWLAGSQRRDTGQCDDDRYAGQHDAAGGLASPSVTDARRRQPPVVAAHDHHPRHFVDPMAGMSPLSSGDAASPLVLRVDGRASDEHVAVAATGTAEDVPGDESLAQQLSALRIAIAAKQALIHRLQSELQRRIDGEGNDDGVAAGPPVDVVRVRRPQTAGGVLLTAAAQEADEALIALPRTPTYSPVDDSEADGDNFEGVGEALEALPDAATWQSLDNVDVGPTTRTSIPNRADLTPAGRTRERDESASPPLPVTAASLPPSQQPAQRFNGAGNSTRRGQGERGASALQRHPQVPAEVLLTISPIRSATVGSTGVIAAHQESASWRRQPPTRGVRVERSDNGDRTNHGRRHGQPRPAGRAPMGVRDATEFRQLGLGSIERPVRRREDVAHDPVLLRTFEEIQGDGSSSSSSDAE